MGELEIDQQLDLQGSIQHSNTFNKRSGSLPIIQQYDKEETETQAKDKSRNGGAATAWEDPY